MVHRGKGLAALIAVFFSFACAQTAPQQSQINQRARFANAANKWMLEPVDIESQKDTVDPQSRSLRDAFWDKCCGQQQPLSSLQTSHLGHYHEGVMLPNTPELPVLRDGAWIIGKFESFHTYLTKSQRAIYTEVNVRVQKVFGQTGLARVSPGQLIDIGDFGGTITAPWGGKYTYEVEPMRYHFQPGHTYLMLIEYRPEGQLYVVGKRWELSNGVVEPEGAEVNRARAGKSEIDGLNEAALSEVMTRKLAITK